MTPALHSGDRVMLVTATAADLQRRDIAVFLRFDGVQVVHRVMAVRKDGVLFSGDNNRHSDGWIRPEQIRFRVTQIFK